MESIDWIIPNLTHGEWILHGFIFLVNIALFVFSRSIVRLMHYDDDDIDTRVKIFRFLNALVLSLHTVDLVLLSLNHGYENYFINLGLSLLVVYGAVFLYSFAGYLARKRFGTEKVVDGSTIYIDSYSSRLIDILLLFFIILTCIYTLIKVWGADSMLETTGIFGIIFAFLAFTSSVWAPDLIAGVIILNTQILEDGDVVLVDGHPDEYIISKVTLIYVILYDVRNNHRTLIRNNQFIRNKIDNLSRIASTDGLRKAIKYNIGYPEIDAETREDRLNALANFKSRIDRMFEAAEISCRERSEITLNKKTPFEWALTQAGDYALEYTLWVYLDRIPNTKVTSKVRKHLMGSLFKINESVFDASIGEGIDLSTPSLATIRLDSGSIVS